MRIEDHRLGQENAKPILLRVVLVLYGSPYFVLLHWVVLKKTSFGRCCCCRRTGNHLIDHTGVGIEIGDNTKEGSNDAIPIHLLL
jgi:hypothetical protein